MLTLGSMVRYPGGTVLDRSSEHYSLHRNFLSDLGMTVAYNGRPNGLGALLFVLALGILVLGLGGCLLGFIRLFAHSARARQWGYAAAVAGLLACVAFLGVAVTPENRAMALHIRFTLFAFRVLPFAVAFLALATRNANVFAARVTLAWCVLAAALFVYAGLLQWGPDLLTHSGLVFFVVAQKIIAIAVTGVVVYVSYEADRVARLN